MECSGFLCLNLCYHSRIGKIGWLLILFFTFSFLFTTSSNASSTNNTNNYGGEDDFSFFNDDSCDQSDWLDSLDCGGYDDGD